MNDSMTLFILTAAVLTLVTIGLIVWPLWRAGPQRSPLAAVLAAGGIAVAVLEGLANHQALAWSATALLFAAAVALDRGGAPAVARYRRSSAIAPSSTPPAAGSGP